MARAHDFSAASESRSRPILPFDDSPFIRKALDELTPGCLFSELEPAQQSRVLQRAEELKRALWRQIPELPVLRISQSCSWCHEFNDVTGGRPVYCSHCGHRGDLPRAYCDCRPCINEAKGGAA